MSVSSPVIDRLDLATKHIYLRAGVREYHPVTDIYTEIRYLRRTDESLRGFDMPVSAFGGVPKGGGKYTSRYAQFNNGWTIVPEDVTHDLLVTGEQITDDGQSGKACMDLTVLSPGVNIFIQYEPPASELVKAEDELAAIKRMAFNEVVTINKDTGVAGTEWPIGTLGNPVSNLVDATTIAENIGVNTLKFDSDYTFPNGTYIVEYTLIGKGSQSTIFSFEAGCVFAYCQVRKATVTGSETGIIGFHKCILHNINSVGLFPSAVDVVARDCAFKGTTALPSNYSGVMTAVNCVALPDEFGNPPIMDFGNCTGELQIRNWSGLLKLMNITEDNDIRMFISSGGVELDPSITSGDFLITGVGVLVNNATSTTSLYVDGLVNKQTITDAVWDELAANVTVVGSIGEMVKKIYALCKNIFSVSA